MMNRNHRYSGWPVGILGLILGCAIVFINGKPANAEPSRPMKAKEGSNTENLRMFLSLYGHALKDNWESIWSPNRPTRHVLQPIFTLDGLKEIQDEWDQFWSPDPPQRTRQLIFSSEDMRSIHDEWERMWFLDEPDPNDSSPFRVHGGVLD